MYEIPDLAAAVAEDLLLSDYEQVMPDSRVFRDLQELAAAALATNRQLAREAHWEMSV